MFKRTKDFTHINLTLTKKEQENMCYMIWQVLCLKHSEALNLLRCSCTSWATGRNPKIEEMVEGLLIYLYYISACPFAHVDFSAGDQECVWVWFHRGSAPRSWRRSACSVTQIGVCQWGSDCSPVSEKCVWCTDKPKPIFISELYLHGAWRPCLLTGYSSVIAWP